MPASISTPSGSRQPWIRDRRDAARTTASLRSGLASGETMIQRWPGAQWSHRRLSCALATIIMTTLLTVMAVDVVPNPASAEPGLPPARTWVTNGRVSTIIHRNGRIYLGGYFNQVGP